MARSGNNALINMLADIRNDSTTIIPELTKQPLPIQEKFVQLFVAYIRVMSNYYSYGYFPNGTQNIAILCKRLDDCGLEHFGSLPNYQYGEILQEG